MRRRAIRKNLSADAAEVADGAGLETWLETERILAKLLHVATLRLPLHETLERELAILLGTSWLRIKSKGGIFLANDDENRLELFVDQGLGPDINAMCAKVPFGRCLCGRVAQSGEILYAGCVDERHENRFEAMKPHGHYAVPIRGQGKVLGVIILYLPHGYAQDTKEISFLRSAANIFSLVIQLKRHEAHLEDLIHARTCELEAEVERRKQREQAHREAEERLGALLELAPEAIISVDQDNRIVLFNHSAEGLFGYDKGEILNQPLERLIPERNRVDHAAHIDAFAKSKDRIRLMTRRGDINGMRKDGSEFPAKGAISLLRTKTGTIYTAMIQDISEQRRADEALRAAKRQAEQANRAKSAFLANTSHELKTPLNAVIGFSELMAQQIHGPLGDPQYLEYAQTIRDRGGHLLGLINDILDISRIETGETALDSDEVDVGALLTKLVGREQAHLGDSDLKLVVEVADDLPMLFADRHGLRKIFGNLLSNAVKFSPDGGCVRARVLVEDGAHVIEISDQGIGMKPEDIETVLTPFAQVDGDLNRKYEGVGLGLALVGLYVEAHGATMTFDSTLGKGTTVCVRFPPERTLGADAGP